VARPIKDGVDYFPLDVALDEKFELIEAEFGLIGFAVVVKLYQRIYERGYYCEWTNEVALLFGHKIGLGGNAVSEIVAAAIRRGIFDKDMFDKYGILTSKGIQKRYFEAVARRKLVNVKKQYLLVSVADFLKSENINFENVIINPENDSNNSQRKVKESKVKKRKENNKCGAAEAATPHRSNAVITIPLNDRTEYEVTDAYVKEWAELYPAVNIMQELRKMKGWCEGNPNKRKTRKGVLRFIHAWLSKAQDQGGSRYGGQRLDHTSVARGGTQTPTQPAASGKYGEYL